MPTKHNHPQTPKPQVQPAQKAKNAQRRKKKKEQKHDTLFDTEGLIVPRNEQNAMLRTVNSGTDRAIRKYLGTLLHPKSNMSRVPDSYARPTALVRSIVTYNVPIQMWSTDPETGRFAIAIQPWLGSISEPSKYKIAMAVSNEVPWKTKDFSSASAYSTVVEGFDIRVDANYSTLTQPPRGSYVLEQTSGTTSPTPFNYPEAANTSALTYFASCVQQVYDPLFNTWRLAPGQYQFNFTATTADSFTAALDVNFHAGTLSDLTRDYVQLLRSPDAKLASISALLTVRRAAVTIKIIAPTTTPSSAYTNCRLSITPAYYTAAGSTGVAPLTVNPASLPTDDQGLLQQYRTVGMSALLTYIGPLLNNGGIVAGAYVPGSSLTDAFFTNAPNPSYGQGQNWERVSTWNNSYNGAGKDGLYGFWTPEDVDEFVLRSPQDAVTQQPPALLLAGQYMPGSAPPDGTVTPVWRLEVVTVYEVTTLSQVLEIEQCVGRTSMMDTANSALANQPHFMANASHMGWLKDFWGGLKKGLSYWEAPAREIWNNRAVLGPLAGL